VNLREGHDSVSSLKESYKDKIEETKKKASVLAGPAMVISKKFKY